LEEPGLEAGDVALGDDDEHRAPVARGAVKPIAPERLDVTISVHFAASEIAALRARAEAAGVEPTTYIHRLVLATEEPPLDRDHLTRLLDALTRDVDELRHAIM
jgi:hypothetical protein